MPRAEQLRFVSEETGSDVIGESLHIGRVATSFRFWVRDASYQLMF